MSDELLSQLCEKLSFEYDRTCRLADAAVRVRSTSPVFPGETYISVEAWDVGGPIVESYDFIWVDPDALTPAQRSDVEAHREIGFRGERFASGFYLTHHHGAPALLLRDDRRTIVVGGDADRVFWSYYIKVLLSQHAWATGGLHLKAAALQWRDATFLLVGRGGSGKTHLTVLSALAGATLLSNTHSLLRDGEVLGVSSTVRLRGALVDRMRADGHLLETHFEQHGQLLDPPLAGLRTGAGSVGPDFIVLTDFRDGTGGVSGVDAETSLAFVEHFAWPVTTYAMKYDAWDFAGGDLAGFSAYVACEQRALRSLVETTPTLRVDQLVDSPRDAIGVLDEVLSSGPWCIEQPTRRGWTTCAS